MRPLSHSSMSLYKECPQKYKFKYIDKLPEKPKHFFSFGRSVHSALERFYNVPAPPAPSLEEVLAHYQENWVSEGYKDAQHESEYYAEGERILREFYAKHVPDFQPPFFAEYKFDITVDGIPVTGYVDRIDKVGRDRIAIIDYKTGKAFGEERVKSDSQLTLYQMACEDLLGMKVESVTFYHLNSLTPITARPHTPEQVRDLRGRIVTVAESIQKGLFEPLPEERKCSFCDYKPHCPVFRHHYGAAPSAPAGRAEGADEDLAVLVDRYGSLLDEIAALQADAERTSKSIAAALREKGWVRAFGASYEVTLESEERWEFQDKAKVLDLIRKAGFWEDILAPSSPLVQKMMRSPSLPPKTRDRLMELGEKVERTLVRCRKTEGAGSPR